MTWSLTENYDDIPDGAEIEGLRDPYGQTAAWRWRMPETVKPAVYIASGIVAQSIFPSFVGEQKHLPYRITFPSLGGCILPGVYTSEAGHTITVEDGR